MKKEKLLTIIIPTYNRENQLKNTLKKLSENKKIKDIQIIILDNDSDYNVEKLKENYKELNLIFKKNSCNIGGNGNIARCFEIVETEWMWLLSDDDNPLNNALDLIMNNIQNAPKDTVLFKYSSEIYQEDNKKEIEGLENLIEFLSETKPNERFGNLMFISTSVYRVSVLKKYVLYAYQYTNAYFPQVAILLFYLNENKNDKVVFCKENIVNLIKDRKDTYISLLVGVGILNTTKNMLFNISQKSDEKMRKLFTLFSYSYRYNFIVLYFSKYNKKIKRNIFKNLYLNNKFEYTIYQKIEAFILYIALSNEVIVRLLKILSSEFKEKMKEDKELNLYTRL